MLESTAGEEDQAPRAVGTGWTDLCLSDSTPQPCTSEMLHPHTGPSSWGGGDQEGVTPWLSDLSMIHFHGRRRELRE